MRGRKPSTKRRGKPRTEQKIRERQAAFRFIENEHVEFEVSGDLAMFSDPLVSIGGERTTYSVPTCEAVEGVTKSVYWKPTFIWVVDQVRVMNPIETEVIGTKLKPVKDGKNDLAYYTYLSHVRYQVRAHIEWNMNRPEYELDRNSKKHYTIFARALLHGGRLPVFLGKSECTASVRPCVFGEGEGAYDHAGTISFGNMYHSITYPDEAYSEETKQMLTLNISPITMKNGVITYPPASACLHQKIHEEKEFKIFPKAMERRQQDLARLAEKERKKHAVAH